MITASSISSSRIGVTGYLSNSSSAYIDDQIKNDESTTDHNNTGTGAGHWIPASGNTYYWPKAVSLDFWAAAPYAEISTAKTQTANDKVKISAYKVNNTAEKISDSALGDIASKTLKFAYDLGVATDADDQPDLMFSSALGLTKDSKGLVNGGCVPLNLEHALASVKFNITSKTKGYIKSISLVDVTKTGLCAYHPNTLNSDETHFTWSEHSGTGAYSHAFNTASVKKTTFKTVDNVTTTTTTNEYDFYTQNETAVFMMIPQTLDGQKVTVVYVEDSGDPDIPACVHTLTGTIRNDSVTSWVAGKTYIYNIVIGGSISVSVTDTMDSTQLVKNNVVITNTGSHKAYIRAAIVANWYDGNGKIVKVKWDESETYGTFVNLAADGSNWVKGGDGYYYYLKQVPAGQQTKGKLFEKYSVKNCTGYPSAHLVMNIVVQAVHAETLAENSSTDNYGTYFELQKTIGWGYLVTRNASTSISTVSIVPLTTEVDGAPATTTTNGQ